MIPIHRHGTQNYGCVMFIRTKMSTQFQKTFPALNEGTHVDILRLIFIFTTMFFQGIDVNRQ